MSPADEREQSEEESNEDSGAADGQREEESNEDSGVGDEYREGGRDGQRDRTAPRTRVGAWLFGDRVGLALFLGVLCFGVLTWRAGIFITDNATLARTLEALSEGRLWIETVDGGDPFNAPGAEVRDGRVYGRNYGQLVVSLPALWLLQAADAVANLRVALFGAVHLVALAFAVVVGDLRGSRRLAALGAGPLVLLSFALNLVLATRLEQPDLPLIALQMTALVVTGLCAVVLYRLLARQSDRRTAALAGAASAVAMPVGFWAAIPKRHVLSTLAVLTVLYLFARSRDPGGRTLPLVGEVPVCRAGAYAVVGLLAWVHAAEGLFAFAVLAAVDLPTAPRNDPRSLAFVGGVFALSMLPTLVTNALVTGEFVRPPRELGGGVTTPAADPGPGGGGTGQSADGGLLEAIADAVPLGVVSFFVTGVLTVVRDSLLVLGEPERLYHVFVRSGGADLTGSRPGFIGKPEFAGTNLSMLETAPLLGLGVAAAGSWLRDRRDDWTAVGRTDPTVLLALGFAVAFVLIYLSRLPLYAQITVRYLLPVFPIALYILARTGTVQRLVERATGATCWTYAGGVLIGGQLFLAVVVARDLPVGEAAQLNATVSLVAAGLVAGTGLVALATRRTARAVGVAVGLACAAGTVFILVAHLYYFGDTGDAILPVVQELTRLL